MAKYVVSSTITVSLSKEVEADSEEQARDIAEGLCVPGLCSACESAGERNDDEWGLGGGLDGSPTDVEVRAR